MIIVAAGDDALVHNKGRASLLLQYGQWQGFEGIDSLRKLG